MKKTILEFIRRGLTACGFGPIVLAILYLILQHQGILYSLTVEQVCLGIVSLWMLAFIAGGLNVLFQIERLPLMLAILIHGGVLYISYLVTYLLNDWLEQGLLPILIFSGIFVFGYLTIWTVIYLITKKNTEAVNRALNQKQRNSEGSSC